MKPLASLSLDLDNEWSYLKTHGDASWEALPSYLDVAVPRGARAAEIPRPDDHVLSSSARTPRSNATTTPSSQLSKAGHEIGKPLVPSRNRGCTSIRRSRSATSSRAPRRRSPRSPAWLPVGFRGPGYSLSPTVLNVLIERGYLYDASTLPTIVGPLARAFYFRLVEARRQATRRALRSVRERGRGVAPAGRTAGMSATTASSRSPSRPFRRAGALPRLVPLVPRRPFAGAARSYFRTGLMMCRPRREGRALDPVAPPSTCSVSTTCNRCRSSRAWR